MSTQEDRLLKNPLFAESNRADSMGLPDFKDMMREALAIEISSKRNDWEVVTDADVGRAAAEMIGVASPIGFHKPETVQVQEPVQPQTPSPAMGSTPESDSDPEGRWRVRGDSKDENGKIKTYEVALTKNGEWSCSCPSRENPCKHTRYIQGRLTGISGETQQVEANSPAEDPVIPAPSPRSPAPPRSMNTTVPQGGIMLGGAPDLNPIRPTPSVDPWSVPDKPKERVIEVGARVTFGGNKR
jgi:hypothetical protein